MGPECATCSLRFHAHGGCPFVGRLKPKGSYLFMEGTRADTLWFVRQGVVLLSRHKGEPLDRPGVLLVRRPGSFVGLESIADMPYADSAYTATESVLCGAEAATLETWLVEAGQTVLATAVRVHAGDFPRCAVGTLPRLARWLAEELPSDLPNQLSRSEVAGVLCMSPETLSRSLSALQERGAIVLKGRRIELANPKALEHAQQLAA